MNKKFKYEIMIGLVLVAGFMLGSTFVFAKDEPEVKKINYHVTSNPKYNYIEKELKGQNSLQKTVEENGVTYELSIVKGNVISKNLRTNQERVVYGNGDAKSLMEVDYYYYNSKYILIVTNDGNLYANVFKNNEEKVSFRKINTNNKVVGLKIVEKELKFYEHNSVELYGLDSNGSWELIKL